MVAKEVAETEVGECDASRKYIFNSHAQREISMDKMESESEIFEIIFLEKEAGFIQFFKSGVMISIVQSVI